MSVPPHQRFAGGSLALRMTGPGLDAAHGSGASSGFDNRGFERFALPSRDGASQPDPIHLSAEDGQCGATVLRRIRMKPEPAVACPVVAGQGIPYCRDGPAQRVQRPSEPERGKTPVDCNAGGRAFGNGSELRERQPGCADGGDGKVGDPEPGLEVAFARHCKRIFVDCRSIAAGFGQQPGKNRYRPDTSGKNRGRRRYTRRPLSVSRRCGRAYSAAFTLSAVIGSERTRAPEAAKIAFAIAGATEVTAGSPQPTGYWPVSISITSISGTFSNRHGV